MRFSRIFVTIAVGIAASLVGLGFWLHGFSRKATPGSTFPLPLVALNPKKPLALPAPPPFHFPDGGETLVPNYRLVALYGKPDAPALGALGQQPMDATIARVKDLAASYQTFSTTPIMPTLEIITTLASSSPTSNNDYSNEADPVTLQPWIDAARAAGVYVVLDLQPGRASFLAQAEEYESLLKQPNVGLALDPEWRVGPAQVPLKQIGSVSIDEVNATDDWLATLTAQNKLPQKLFVLQEFRSSMLPNRTALDTSHKELAYVVQMDGQGAQSVKSATWRAILQQPPGNVQFGWKNFYVKDSPVLTPQQTMALTPQPYYVSYE
ncbi:MAG TPA: hypothetical protein VIM53_01200 [Candidatus Saccharimonadales bacterium]